MHYFVSCLIVLPNLSFMLVVRWIGAFRVLNTRFLNVCKIRFSFIRVEWHRKHIPGVCSNGINNIIRTLIRRIMQKIPELNFYQRLPQKIEKNINLLFVASPRKFDKKPPNSQICHQC